MFTLPLDKAPTRALRSRVGLPLFSTPFDATAVELLEELGITTYKIASFENNHLPLIRRVAETGTATVSPIAIFLALSANARLTIGKFREHMGVGVGAGEMRPAPPESVRFTTCSS